MDVVKGVGIMKKVLLSTVVISIVFCAMSVLACSQKEVDVMTGGACSVSELNNIEKSRIKNENSNLTTSSKEVRDLRPVRVLPVTQKFDYDGCVLGNCLYKILLGK